MKRVELKPKAGTDGDVLTSESFAEGAALYVVKGDFKVKSKVVLPLGSELRVEEGSIEVPKTSTGLTPIETGGTFTPGDDIQPINPGFPSNPGLQIMTMPSDGIYMLCSGQDESAVSAYGALCLSCRVNLSGINMYQSAGGKILEVGGYVKYTSENSFEMNLNCGCRILLPKDTVPAKLRVLSDKVNKIQIDGLSNFQLYAKDCRLERISVCSNGWGLVNTVANSVNYNYFLNCEISLGSRLIGMRCDLRAVVDVAGDGGGESKQSESLNWLVMRDCVVDNVGLEGSVSADNCMFILGKSLAGANRSLLCGSHSRLTNCIFDGHTGITSSNFSAKAPFADIPLLSECVIDLAGASDALVDGCTFLAFKAKDGKVPSLIRVSADGDAASLPTDAAELENYVGSVRGISIHNCYFDLPDFAGCGISVSNVVADASAEQQEANYRVTLIDGNYVDMPVGHAFVWCPDHAANLTVRNNSGCQNNALVLLGNGDNSTTAVKRLENGVIEGNILRYQRYTCDAGMCILKGVSCHNLTLSGNTVYGAVWNMENTPLSGHASGYLKMEDNESIDEVFFLRSSHFRNQEGLNVTFSGNISDGLKTDVGTTEFLGMNQRGPIYVGRQYFDTTTRKLRIFDGLQWLSI